MRVAIASIALCLSLLLPSISGSISHHQHLPHITVFGKDISDSVCRSRSIKADLEDILAGNKLPYAYVGPSQNCNNAACLHEYWKSRSRWDGTTEPACPIEARKRLIAKLSKQALQGSSWIYDALSMKPCDLWPLIRNRTVWIAGDSLSQDFTTSLVSFMIEYMEDEGRPISEDAELMQHLTKSPSGKDMPAWCIHFASNTRICSLRANKSARMANVVLTLLPQFADQDRDIVILNFGAWYNYLDDGMGELQRDMIEFEASFNALCSQLPKRVIWRECTAQHFNTTSGMFDPKASIADQRCVPAGSKLNLEIGLDPQRNLVYSGPSCNETWELDILLKGGHRNNAIQPAIDRLGMETLRIWNVSLVLSEFHNNYHRPDSHGECVYVECDCSHACSPSWYQLMFADLKIMLEQDWDAKLAKLQKSGRCNSSLAVI